MKRTLSAAEFERLGSIRQPWVTPALRPFMVNVEEVAKLDFVHHKTLLNGNKRRKSRLLTGHTVWIARGQDGQCAAISFDFAEIEKDVFCVRDMLAISSNVYPVDEEGCVLDDGGRLFCLARLIYPLPWQRVVAEHKSATVASP